MESIKTENLKFPYVRFLNAYKGDVYFNINGKRNDDVLPFGEFTGYIKLENGKNEFTAYDAQKNNVIYGNIVIDFMNNDVYTVAIVSIADTPSLYGIYEPTDQKENSMGNVRICNLSPDLSMADIFANNYKILGDVDYLEVSKYIALVPNTYDFTVKKPNDDMVVLNAGKQIVRSDKYNTMYIVGYRNTQPQIRGLFSIDAGNYNGMYL